MLRIAGALVTGAVLGVVVLAVAAFAVSEWFDVRLINT